MIETDISKVLIEGDIATIMGVKYMRVEEEQPTLKVTEHNITEWKLTDDEIQNLIRLVKSEIKAYEQDKVMQTYYGIILGKLIIMNNDTQ